MCASCGCGCKHGIAAKGCSCKCKDCREARTSSVEKFHLVRKANRGFEAIADALLEDVYEDDLVVDDEGNVYALVGEIDVEKSEKSRRYASNAAMGAGAAGVAGGAAAVGAGVHYARKGSKMGGKGLGTILGGGVLADLGIKTGIAGAGLTGAGAALRAYNKSKKNDVTKSLSPKQMKIASKAGNPKKIDAADLAALRNGGVAKGLPSALRAAGKGIGAAPKVPFGPGQTYISARVAAAQAAKPAGEYLRTPGYSHIAEGWKGSGMSDRNRSRQVLDSMTNGGKGKIDRDNRLGLMAEKRKALIASRPPKPNAIDSNRPAW